MPTKTLNLPDHIELAQFVSAEAHDLRTPFNQLVGFSKIVLNGQDGPLTDLQREDLTIVYQSSLRALTLMNYLIDIARLSRSEKDPSPVAVDWPPLLEQAVAQWRRFNASRTLQAEISIAQGVSAITADELQLKQIIVGLIGFVAEYVADVGQIRIQVDEEPGWCVASIQSEGKKSRFQSKLDTEILGYISRSLVELNQGVLRGACETDTGAAVCFALPRQAT